MKNNITFFLALLFLPFLQNVIYPSVKKSFKKPLAHDKKITLFKKNPLRSLFFPRKINHFNGKIPNGYFKRYERIGNNTLNRRFSIHNQGCISFSYVFNFRLTSKGEPCIKKEWKCRIPHFMVRNLLCMRELYSLYSSAGNFLLEQSLSGRKLISDQLSKAFKKISFLKRDLYNRKIKKLHPEYFVQKKTAYKRILQGQFFQIQDFSDKCFLDINPFFYLLLKKGKCLLLANISIENLLALYITFTQERLSFDKLFSKKEIAFQLSLVIKNVFMKKEFKTMPYALLKSVIWTTTWLASQKNVLWGLHELIKKTLQKSEIFKKYITYEISLERCFDFQSLVIFYHQLKIFLLHYQKSRIRDEKSIEELYPTEYAILRTLEKISSLLMPTF